MGTACACAACPLLALYAPLARAEDDAREVDVGPAVDYARAGVYELTKQGHPFFLVNRKGKLYAVSSTCTHKRVEAEGGKGRGRVQVPAAREPVRCLRQGDEGAGPEIAPALRHPAGQH